MNSSAGYAPVDRLKLYYEVHGAASPARPPLVLLHGGGDTIRTSFGDILPKLARVRQVIAFERQGYGHTADVADRPSGFEHRPTIPRLCSTICMSAGPISLGSATAAQSPCTSRFGTRRSCVS